MASTGQSDISTYASRSREPCRIVNRCLEGERCERAHTRHGHEPAALRIRASQFCNLTVKLPDLLLDGIARFEQRPERSHQLRTILDQLLGSYSEDIERATSDHETEVLEKVAHLVLEIALDLDQQCSTPQQCSDRVAVDILTCTSLNQPVCMMRAIPIASLRSLLLICILRTALAWRASMQTTGRPRRLSSVHSHVDVGPVSRPMRTASGAFDFRNTEISPGSESTTPLARPILSGPLRRLMSASTTRPIRHSVPLSLSIVARPHEAVQTL